jgi:hypothetical protein
MSTTGITSSGATLNWTATVDPQQWQVQYKKSNGGSWTNILMSGSSRSTTVTGLQKNTSYIWHIRANCSGVWTTYSGNVSFTTLSAKDEQAALSSEVKLNLYPNPTNGNFMIELTSGETVNGTVQIELLNSLGQIVYNEEGPIVNGVVREQINLQGQLVAGRYFVRVIAGEKVTVSQVIITK